MEYPHYSVGVGQSPQLKVRNDQLNEIISVYGKSCRTDYVCNINGQFSEFMKVSSRSLENSQVLPFYVFKFD